MRYSTLSQWHHLSKYTLDHLAHISPILSWSMCCWDYNDISIYSWHLWMIVSYFTNLQYQINIFMIQMCPLIVYFSICIVSVDLCFMRILPIINMHPPYLFDLIPSYYFYQSHIEIHPWCLLIVISSRRVDNQLFLLALHPLCHPLSF